MVEVFTGLSQGFSVALQPINLLYVVIGCFSGTLIGALPGIGPINGVAILLPIAYSMGLPPESALILLAGIYYGAEYGGRVSSILLNVPGDAGAVFTTLDGNPMAKRGEAGRALSLSAIASFVGGTIAVILMSLFGPLLASVAVKFSPSDYVALMVFAFASLSSLIGKNPVKTLLGAVIGLMISTIGIDANTGVPRFTFGIPDILAGIDFLVIVIGLFGMAELISLVEQQVTGKLKVLPIGKSFVSWKDLAYVKWTILRSALIGFFIGVLPGTGASVASAVAYGTEKRIAGESGKSFGTGDVRGLAAPESANNGAAGGAMVPMLTLGIPGSGTTAILLGALLLFNVTPGPPDVRKQAGNRLGAYCLDVYRQPRPAGYQPAARRFLRKTTDDSAKVSDPSDCCSRIYRRLFGCQQSLRPLYDNRARPVWLAAQKASIFPCTGNTWRRSWTLV